MVWSPVGVSDSLGINRFLEIAVLQWIKNKLPKNQKDMDMEQQLKLTRNGFFYPSTHSNY